MNIRDWRNIDSAPKDGEEIIVCRAGTLNIEFVRRYADGCDEWLDRCSDPFENPTHWMPIRIP